MARKLRLQLCVGGGIERNSLSLSADTCTYQHSRTRRRGGGGGGPPFCQAGPDHGQKDHGKNNQLEPTIQQ